MKKEKEAKAKKKKKSGRLSTIILVLILLVGVGIMLYPTISDYWNSFHQTRAIQNYDDIVAHLEEEDYDDLFAAAEAYNEHLRQLSLPYAQYDRSAGRRILQCPRCGGERDYRICGYPED